jgi:hypothetical protein
MAGWGVLNAFGMVVALNLGFSLGLLLRAGTAFWSTHKIGRLFAPSGHADKLNHRLDGAWAGGEH